MPTDRRRLDEALVLRGRAESRAQAQRLIRAGRVRVDGQRVDKPSRPVAPESEISVDAPPRFVSRGGEKLEAAMAQFSLDVAGAVCLDVGASTGGFTDCLLQRGAARVIALDVGRGQLHWRLRSDPRVTVLEGVNARALRPEDLPERPAFACVDVSFISLRKVLPAVAAAVAPGSPIVTLIKPQFEAGRGEVARGGVVRDPEVRRRVVDELRRFGVESLGLTWIGAIESPLRGPAGNVEYLAVWRRP